MPIGWVVRRRMDIVRTDDVPIVLDGAAGGEAEHERLSRVERTATAAQVLAGQVCWEAHLPTGLMTWTSGLPRLIGLGAGEPVPGLGELLGMVVPGDRRRVTDAVTRAVEDGAGFDCEVRLRGRDGRERTVRLWGQAEREVGPVERLWGVVTDVTALRDAQRAARRAGQYPAAVPAAERYQALRASEERFRLAFDGAPIGMALLAAADGRFLRVNRAFCRLVGHAQSRLAGLSATAVAHPDDAAAVTQGLADLAAGRAGRYSAEHRYRNADGRDLWVLANMSLVRDEAQAPGYVVLQVEDITARREAEEELSHRAMHDPLTGLPNRMLLLDHLAGALARAERQQTYVAVMFLDLDHFKDVNDSLGHDAGDELLVDIAQRLRRVLRETDTAARLGGDEFVVVCEGMAAPEEAAISAARIERALQTEIAAGDEVLSITVSVGIATSRGGTPAGDLLRDADAAMYRAKQRGRARFEIADPALHARTERHARVEAELRNALSGGELVVHYQPAYDLQANRPVAVEALVRWLHPRRGLLQPREFLDVAEERELIVELGGWVLREACRQAAQWPSLDLWVNVSARQLAAGALIDQVRRALDESGMDAGRLCLELPERQLVAAARQAAGDLLTLPATGARLCVDHVGGAHAGVGYLDRVPVHALKIDRKVVAGVGTSRAGLAMTRSLLTLGQAMDMTVAAEGVETTGQRDRLRDLGCDVAQGFALHPPVAASNMASLVG